MGTALRLAKLHASAGRPEREQEVLEEALVRAPDDKDTHFAMAMHLLSRDPPDMRGAERHLASSFTVDDQNFEARHMLAQLVFAKGDPATAAGMFDEVARRAPPGFRRYAPRQDNPITSQLPECSGTIDVARGTHFLMRTGAYPTRILVPRSAFEEQEVDDIEVGEAVVAKLRFDRRGPVAVECRRAKALLKPDSLSSAKRGHVPPTRANSPASATS